MWLVLQSLVSRPGQSRAEQSSLSVVSHSRQARRLFLYFSVLRIHTSLAQDRTDTQPSRCHVIACIIVGSARARTWSFMNADVAEDRHQWLGCHARVFTKLSTRTRRTPTHYLCLLSGRFKSSIKSVQYYQQINQQISNWFLRETFLHSSALWYYPSSLLRKVSSLQKIKASFVV